MKKLKSLLIVAALILGVGGAFATATSNATPDQVVPSTATVWQFNGQTLAEDKDASNYINITGQPLPTCTGSGLPCYIVVNSGTLENYLNSHTAQEIRDNAPEQRQ